MCSTQAYCKASAAVAHIREKRKIKFNVFAEDAYVCVLLVLRRLKKRQQRRQRPTGTTRNDDDDGRPRQRRLWLKIIRTSFAAHSRTPNGLTCAFVCIFFKFWTNMNENSTTTDRTETRSFGKKKITSFSYSFFGSSHMWFMFREVIWRRFVFWLC